MLDLKAAVFKEDTRHVGSDSDSDDENYKGKQPVHMLTFDRQPAVFLNVGGPKAWRKLLSSMGQANHTHLCPA